MKKNFLIVILLSSGILACKKDKEETLNPTVENVAPTVSITSPENNSTTYVPSPATRIESSAIVTKTISATAADSDGSISKVEFYNGSTLIGTDVSSPYSIEADLELGEHTLTAKAYDNSNATTTSSTVKHTVAMEIIPPIVGVPMH